jgi:hypothetical protein
MRKNDPLRTESLSVLITFPKSHVSVDIHCFMSDINVWIVLVGAAMTLAFAVLFAFQNFVL